MKWRACVLYKFVHPDLWDEVQADSFEELLERLKANGKKEPFRVIIYRRVDNGDC